MHDEVSDVLDRVFHARTSQATRRFIGMRRCTMK